MHGGAYTGWLASTSHTAAARLKTAVLVFATPQQPSSTLQRQHSLAQCHATQRLHCDVGVLCLLFRGVTYSGTHCSMDDLMTKPQAIAACNAYEFLFLTACILL
jgi:hypothetical protein